jgi:hypothetical protein
MAEDCLFSNGVVGSYLGNWKPWPWPAFGWTVYWTYRDGALRGQVEAKSHLFLDVYISCEKVKTMCTCSRVCGGDASEDARFWGRHVIFGRAHPRTPSGHDASKSAMPPYFEANTDMSKIVELQHGKKCDGPSLRPSLDRGQSPGTRREAV